MHAATKAYRGTFYVFVSLVITGVLGYAQRVLYARSFEPADYGLLYAIISFVTIISVIRGLGLTEAVTFFVSKAKRGTVQIVRTALEAQLAVGIVLFALVAFFSPFIALFLFHAAHASTVVVFFMVAFVVIGVGEICAAYFRGQQRMFLYSLIDPLRQGLVLLFSVLFLLYSVSLPAVALAWLAAYLTVSAVYAVLLLREKSYAQQKISRKQLFDYALPSLLVSSGLVLFYNFDMLALTFMRGTLDSGLYAAAFSFVNLLMVCGLPFAFALFPAVSSIYHKRDYKQMQYIIQIFYKYSFIALLVFSVVLAATAKQYIALIFGSVYVGATSTLLWLILATILRGGVELQFSILGGVGAVRERAKMLYAALVVNFVLNVIFIRYYGSAGAAFATAVSFAVLFASSVVVLQKYRVSFPWRSVRTLFLATVPFVATAFLQLPSLPVIYLLSYSGLIALIYIAWLFILRIVRIDDVRAMTRIIKSALRNDL